MAKKSVRRGKRKSSGASRSGRIGKWTAGTLFLIGCFVAAHFLYDALKNTDLKPYIPRLETSAAKDWADEQLQTAKDLTQDLADDFAQNGLDKTRETLAETKAKLAETKSKLQTAEMDKPAEKLSDASADAGLPVLLEKRTEQVIRHEGYTVSYNSDYRIANWVSYELTRQEAQNTKASRSNKFVPDPAVTGATALNEDYSRTGYDKGHLAPAGDMKWSLKAMQESFYFSNICPQKPGLNRGVWRELEEQCRLWASDYGPLQVATGPVIEKDLRRLGKNRVGIPKTFYKVLCMKIDGRYEAIGFLFENKDYKNSETFQQHVVSVDEVEKTTGIDFFPGLPDEIENRMEAKVNLEAWSF